MLDFIEFIDSSPVFKKFNVDELLFTAYDCVIDESPLDYWAKKSYFCYVIRGGARWKTTQNEYTFNVGDALFLKEGVHRAYNILDGDFCGLLIFIPDEYIASIIQNNNLGAQKTNHIQQTDSVIPLEIDQTLDDYFNSVLNYFNQSTPPAKSLLKLKFNELIVNIVTGKHNPLLKEHFKEILTNKKRDLNMIMEENYMFNLNMEEFASLCSRSLATFNRDFKKIYHSTPSKWLKTKRLSLAKLLVETTNLNINEIALESGFGNTSHFVKVFKNSFGQSPLKYRKLLNPTF